MIAAGLLARKAVEAGLQCKPWVKTSLAPGSRVVTRYLDNAGLTRYLEKLGFNLVVTSVASEQFDVESGRIFDDDEKWRGMPAPKGTLFEWVDHSGYVREPPYFIDFASEPEPPSNVDDARALAVLGNTVTTDHISPAGAIAGREYGSGSSRDWAAKGAALLGIKATIAESYERIHRSNLVSMGVLPLQFRDGETAQSLGLNGTETFSISGIDQGIKPRQSARVSVIRQDGSEITFDTIVRIDATAEVEYFRHNGICRWFSGNSCRPVTSGFDSATGYCL